MQKLNSSFEEENLILGVNLGKRMGLSIFYYGVEIEISFYNSIEESVFHIIGILGGLRAKKNSKNWRWKYACCKTNCKNT